MTSATSQCRLCMLEQRTAAATARLLRQQPCQPDTCLTTIAESSRLQHTCAYSRGAKPAGHAATACTTHSGRPACWRPMSDGLQRFSSHGEQMLKQNSADGRAGDFPIQASSSRARLTLSMAATSTVYVIRSDTQWVTNDKQALAYQQPPNS